nr:hypothetical protein [Corynebacterium lactis]
MLIDEQTGENVASSAFPGLAGGDYEVIDRDGNVIQSREEVHAAWEAEKKRQAELEATDDTDYLAIGPVLVEQWNQDDLEA